MQIYRWLCLGERKDVWFAGAEVEFETAEWSSVSHPFQCGGVSGVPAEPLSGFECMNVRAGRDLSLGSLRASSLPWVIAPSPGAGAGAQGQSRDQSSGPWPPGPGSPATALPPCGCPSVPVCVVCGVSGAVPRVGVSVKH